MENYYEGSAAMPDPPPASPRGRRKRIPLWIALGLIAAALIGWGITAVARVAIKRVDVLSIEGTIAATAPQGLLKQAGYDHHFTINAIDRLMYDRANQALVLWIDSPGGGVYETDELYLKLMEYKETTGRPIYASFGSYAASGGYYAAMASDFIFSNRNCVTGSIGVRLGTTLEMSGLMDKLGIKAETITSGDNKAMGDGYTPLTEEQRAILQAYVDESYDQFISIVDQGRESLTLEQVRGLADGRIYTARQALSNGLIDEIGTLDDAIEAVKADNGLEGCEVSYITQEISTLSQLFSTLDGLRPRNAVESAADAAALLASRSGYYCADLPINGSIRPHR